MFNYLRLRLKISNLFNKEKKLNKEYFKYLKNTKDKKDKEIILFERNFEVSIIETEIETLLTNYYINIAKKNFLEIPNLDDEDLWKSSSIDNNIKVLTNKAIQILKNKKREEIRYCYDFFIKVIVAVTGLIGALIGLISIL